MSPKLQTTTPVTPISSKPAGRIHRKTRPLWFRAARTVLALLLFVGLAVAGVYFWMNPPSFGREQSQVEALAKMRTSMGGELSAFEQMMNRKPRARINNSTILQLWRAKVASPVIVQLIRTSATDFDVSANAIIELKNAGVDDTIMLAMVDASYKVQ